MTSWSTCISSLNFFSFSSLLVPPFYVIRFFCYFTIFSGTPWFAISTIISSFLFISMTTSQPSSPPESTASTSWVWSQSSCCRSWLSEFFVEFRFLDLINPFFSMLFHTVVLLGERLSCKLDSLGLVEVYHILLTVATFRAILGSAEIRRRRVSLIIFRWSYRRITVYLWSQTLLHLLGLPIHDCSGQCAFVVEGLT